MKTRSTTRAVALTAVCLCLLCLVPRAQERAVPLSDAQIDAALRIASDDAATKAFLATHRLRAGGNVEDGPTLGWISTPFSRVVLSGVAARRAGHGLTRDDVSIDPLRSELAVIATPQPAAAATTTLAQITEIAVETRVGAVVTDMLLPMRMRPATLEERTLHGIESVKGTVVAVFSIDAVAPMLEARNPNVVVRVTFDTATRGRTPLTACRDCLATISEH